MVGEGYGYHKTFGKSNSDLQKAIARCIIKLCTEKCHPQEVTVLMASRLMPLNKNSSLRLLCVGEVLRRIIKKVVIENTTQINYRFSWLSSILIRA